MKEFIIYEYDDNYQPQYYKTIEARNINSAKNKYLKSEGLKESDCLQIDYPNSFEEPKIRIALRTEYYDNNGNITKELTDRHYEGYDSNTFYCDITEKEEDDP